MYAPVVQNGVESPYEVGWVRWIGPAMQPWSQRIRALGRGWNRSRSGRERAGHAALITPHSRETLAREAKRKWTYADGGTRSIARRTPFSVQW